MVLIKLDAMHVMTLYGAVDDDLLSRCTRRLMLDGPDAEALVSAIDDSEEYADMFARFENRTGEFVTWMPMPAFVRCAEESYAAATLAPFVAQCKAVAAPRVYMVIPEVTS